MESKSSQAPPLPVDLFECFEQNLPSLTRKDVKYESAGSSGTYTNTANPPEILTWKPVAYYTGKATSFFEDQNNVHVIEHLRQLRITTTFTNMTLDNEQSVVNASILYLVGPIMEVLKLKYGDDWTVHSEYSVAVNQALQGTGANVGAPTGAKQTKKTKPTTVRYDLVFRTKNDKTIAILEYKKRESIRFKDYERVWLKENATQADKADVIGSTEDDSSLLEFNGSSHMKQLTAYAETENCKHTALFNWNHLLFVYFHELEKDANTGKRSVGQEAYATWITEANDSSCRAKSTGKRSDFVEDCRMRIGLFGWLLTAFQDAFGY